MREERVTCKPKKGEDRRHMIVKRLGSGMANSAAEGRGANERKMTYHRERAEIPTKQSTESTQKVSRLIDGNRTEARNGDVNCENTGK